MNDYNPMTNPFHPLSTVNAAHQQAAVQAELITGIPQGSGTTAWTMVPSKEQTTEPISETGSWIFFGVVAVLVVLMFGACARASM